MARKLPLRTLCFACNYLGRDECGLCNGDGYTYDKVEEDLAVELRKSKILPERNFLRMVEIGTSL